jgi:hypothetical protein
MRRASVLVALLFLVSVQGAAAAYRPLDAHHSEALCDPGHAGHLESLAVHGGTSQQGNDNFDWNNGLFICYGANIADLNTVSQDSNDDCHGFAGYDGGKFGDCISSFRFDYMSPNEWVCLYVGTNYTGSAIIAVGDAIVNSLNSTFNDAISSIKWIPANGSC